MSPIQKPTILIIHGLWHSPKHFRPLRNLFESHGFETECPTLPTFNAKAAPPTISLAEDVSAVQAVLTRLIEGEGKEVIVILHSYGGIVGTQAVLEAFSKKARGAKNLSGGVIRLFYVAAFLLPMGASLEMAVGGELPPFIKVEDNGLCNMDDPDIRFYNDLAKEEQDQWISELAPVPVIALKTAITYAAYQHHPTTYLYCENDQAVQWEVQKIMVAGAGIEIDTETCTAGHSPYLSQQQLMLDMVNKFVEV